MPTMRCPGNGGQYRSMFPLPTIHSDLAHGRQADLIDRAERHRQPPDTPRDFAARSEAPRRRSARRPRLAPKEAATVPHVTTNAGPRELAFRAEDGIEVSLVWNELEDRLNVTVFDSRSGELLELDARHDNALDVFYHPFAH